MSKIRLSKSCLSDREESAVLDVLREEYLGMGRWVEQFEQALQARFDGRSVTCVATGTAALHLGLMGAGIGSGDEVLVQSLTFVASFQAITATGARPVPCEVDPATCTIDLADAARRLSDRTRAIMPVHYASRPGPLDEIYAFAEANGLRVVEDAAHAFGGEYRGRPIGATGDVACFSFDGIKNITSGEGGAVVTADPEVRRFVEDARLLGVERDTEKRYRGERSWAFDVTRQGYRFHMSNIMAAIGLAQLARLDGEFIPARRRLAHRYHQRLQGVNGITLLPDDYDEIVPHIFPIRVGGGRRDTVRAHLLEHDIECGIHYVPNHLLTFFRTGGDPLPVTEELYGELLTLPLHPDLSERDQDRVIEELVAGLVAAGS